MRLLLYPLMLLLIMEIASAAILHGTIYDTKLTKLNDVIVEINSTPSQIFVSKEGQYSFVLEPGSYEITAKYQISGSNYLYTSDDVVVARDGYFVKDLFLKPARKVQMPGGIGSGYINYTLLASIISIILLALLGYAVYKLKFANRALKEQEFDKYTGDMLKAIREEGGRTTQKDIRKKIPLSEAKISLMITELENKGILKRIKKGRGNIIVFNQEKR